MGAHGNHRAKTKAHGDPDFGPCGRVFYCVPIRPVANSGRGDEHDASLQGESGQFCESSGLSLPSSGAW